MHPSLYPTPAPTCAPGTPLHDQIAAYLAALLPSSRPRRVARMYDPGQADKYRDIPRSAPFGLDLLRAHAAGGATWATTLDADGQAQLGAIEVDAGGRSALLAVLSAAAALRLVAFAIAVDNPLNGHTGGHVWFLYDRPYAAGDIAAQLRQVATTAGLPDDTEIWPCNQVIRLPFGMHRWAQTHGELLLQSGEVIDLDSDLAAGFAAVAELPRNDAPPAAPAPAQTQNSKNFSPRRSAGEQAAERLSASETIAAANRANDLGAYLEHHGAHLVRTRGEQRYYSGLAGEQHTHEYTFTVSPARNGIGQIGYCYSSSGRLSKSDFPCGFRFFDAFLALEHAGDRVAALKALTPERRGRRPTRPPDPPPSEPDYVLTPAEQARREADKLRARAYRRAAAAATIADVRTCAAADNGMHTRAQKMLEAHITLANLTCQHTWSIAAQARQAQLSERNAQIGNQYLIEHGYLARELRGPKQTAKWTILVPGAQPSRTLQTTKSEVISAYAEGSPMLDHESDSDPMLVASERAPAPQPDRELLSYVRALAAELGDTAALLVDYAELPTGQLLEVAEQLEQRLADVDQVETAAAVAKTEIISDLPTAIAEAWPAGAWYDPAADWTAGGICVLSPANCGISAVARGQPDDQAEVIELAPLVQAPPAAGDLTYGAFIRYWNMAKQEWRPQAQRAWARREAQRYMVDVSPEEAALRWHALSSPPAPATRRGNSAPRASTRRKPASGARAAPPSQAPGAGAGQALDMFAGVLPVRRSRAGAVP